MFSVRPNIDDAGDACDGWGLPAGICSTDLLTEWVAAALAGLFLLVIGRPLWNWYVRRQFGGDGTSPEFTDELRLGLLAEARRRTWGQLNQLIRLPSGFTDLKLEPRVGLVDGPRSNPDVIDLRTEQLDIVNVFDQAQQRLLIVGQPGAGKTILLYKVAEALEQRHMEDSSRPLPVVLNLSSWKSGSTVEGWVVDQLCDRIQGLGFPDRRLAASLLSTGGLALLLDGLDEVPDAYQPGCLQALNEFLPAMLAGLPIVVTSRIDEFASLVEKESPLGLLDAREAMPLSLKDVKHNLAALAKGSPLASTQARWKDVADQVHTTAGRPLRDALTSPLILSLAAETSRLNLEPMLKLESPADIQSRICHSRVTEALEDELLDRSRPWLVYIAGRLKQDPDDQIAFYMESLTAAIAPSWLRLVSGLVFGLGGGLFIGLAGGLSIGLAGGLVFGLFGGLFLGLVFSLSEMDARPTSHRYRRPSRSQLRSGLVSGVSSGLAGGLPVGLLAGHFFGLNGGLVGGLLSGLFGGLFVGLFGGLFEAFRVDLALVKLSGFDESFRLSLASYRASVFQWILLLGLVGGLLGGLFGGVVFGVLFGVAFGVIFGVVIGLDDGGAYFVLQRLTRRRLRRDGVMPIDPQAPLEWAVNEGLMRRVGGGYQFRHNLIRDAFAGLDPHGRRTLQKVKR